MLISWCKPFCEVTCLIFLPSSLVISLFYQLLDVPSGHQTDVLWTSNGRLYDDRPSIENMVRPEDVQIVSHYGRPLDTPIGRRTDVHLRPIQRRHVCKFISWTISSFIYFKVLCTKNFKYFSLCLKMWLLKR